MQLPVVRPCVAIVLALLASPLGELAHAQPEPGDYSAPTHQVKESRGHKVAMRDGVKLSVDLYQPAGEGRFPAILIHTPYGNNPTGGLARARWFAQRGYVVAASDCRGRFDSDGQFDPFDARHKTDGYDLVEWLVAQPWCDGAVGMIGGSYLGWTQWWTATQAPPHLRAIVPEVAPPDQFRNGPYQEGVLVCWAIDWAAMMSGRVMQSAAEGPYGGFGNHRDADYRQLPYLGINTRRGAIDNPWYETWIRENLSTASYWQDIAYQRPEDYARVTVPTLGITGWFDANFPGTPANYLGMKQHGGTPEARRPHMVIGPWQHGFNRGTQLGRFDYGPSSVIDWDGYACRWLDHWLKGVDNGVTEDAPVQVFVMGRNRWHAERDWPLPQTQWTKYYLHSGGQANSAEGDGTLDTQPPAAEPADSYVYNPDDPTPSPFTGGHLEDGPADTRAAAARPDVLVYTTPPLDEAVEVTGPIEARLFAATSAQDTDWMVRLIDVHPDGYAALLCDGVIRARCRDPENGGAFTSQRLSAIEPGQAYEYTIRFWRGTANEFAAGHRIRVEISSSYFPYYLRNLNTGADNVGLETTSVTATQTIYHDAQHPSHIVLPIIPRREGTAAAGEAAEWRLASPRPYQVVQRQGYIPAQAHEHQPGGPALGFADVPIVSAAPPAGSAHEVRVVALDGGDANTASPVVDWTAVAGTIEADQFHASIRVPAGGWYRLEMRAKADGRIVAAGAVEPIGVGEVFLIAGQSYATNTNEDRLRISDPRGRVAACDVATGDWRVAHDPQPAPDGSDGGSIWPEFGNLLLPAARVPVGLVNVAVGGTSSRQWLPGGALHDRLIVAGRRHGPFRAVLWQQGESDVIEKTPIETYVSNLQAIRHVAADAWGFDAPWLLAKSTLHPTVYNDPEGEGRIRAAIDRLTLLDGFQPGPDTDILGGDHRGGPGTRRHFSGSGQRAAALLWFAVAWGEMNRSPDGAD
jgi:putative CocE/NonD family hydrolase